MGDTLVAIVFFGCVAAVVLVPRGFRFLERRKALEVMRSVYERGQVLPPEFVASILDTKRDASRSPGVEPLSPEGVGAPAPDRDLRRGAVLIALALGFGALGLAFSGSGKMADASLPWIGFSAIPGFIGLTFIGLWLLDRRKRG